MPTITRSVDISRSPDEVFWYVTDPSHFPQWQDSALSARNGDKTSFAAGSRTVVVRRVGPVRLTTTEEITDFRPPRSWAVRGAGGVPVVMVVHGTVEPMDGGRRSRVTLSFDFEASGVGVLLEWVLRRVVRKELPRQQRKLKGILEGGVLGCRSYSPNG